MSSSLAYVTVFVFVVIVLIAIRLCFILCEEDDDASEISHSKALFTVTKRLKRLYTGSKVYVGLRIPDLDSAPRNIDLLVVTYQQAIVISLKSVSGFVCTDKEGNWITKHNKTQSQWIPDPVAEAKESLTILQKYLERRGIALPEGYLCFKVICPNLKFGSIDADSFPPEVVTYDRWALLKSEQEKSFSEWLKCIRSGGLEMQESFTEKLNSILVTTPTWDRLEFSSRYVLI